MQGKFPNVSLTITQPLIVFSRTRQIKNGGFDLLFPGQENISNGPLLPQKSGRSRKTPQPELPPQKSGRSRKTPQPEPSNQRSTRKAPAIEDSNKQRATRRTPALDELSQQHTAKQASTNGPTKKRGRPKGILDQSGDKAVGSTEVDGVNGVVPKKRKLNPEPKKGQRIEAVGAVAGSAESEVQVKSSQPEIIERELPVGGVKKRRKRKSIGQQSGRKTKTHEASPMKSAIPAKKRGPKPKSNIPQPIDPVAHSTPEPPEYSRITTPAFLDREQSQGFANGETTLNGGSTDNADRTANAGDGSEEIKKSRRRKGEVSEERPKKLARVRSGKKVSNDEPDSLEGAKPAIAALRKPEKEKAAKKRGRPSGKAAKNQEKLVATPAIEETQATQSIAETRPQTSNDLRTDEEAAAGQDLQAESIEPPKQDKPKRRKRRSIGQQSLRAKRKSTGTNTSPIKSNPRKPSSSKATRESRPKKTTNQPADPAPTHPLDIVEEAEDVRDILDELPQPPRQQRKPRADCSTETSHSPKKRGRPRKADTAQKPSSIPTAKAPRAPKAPKPPSKSSKPAKPTKISAPPKRKPRSNQVPITIYVPASPTTSMVSTPSTTSDAMIDPLSHPPPHAQTTTTTTRAINAIDVLAQSTSETLSHLRTTLPKPSQKTVDIYAEELHNRLLQHTIALNENTELEKRVRKAAAEETALKKEIKALERDEERVRVEREERRKEGERERLEGMLEGIKGAVERGWAMEKGEKEIEGGGEDFEEDLERFA